MITRIVIQDKKLHSESEKTGSAPAGWYSRQQVGSHDERETRLVLEGVDRRKKPGGDFIYWENRMAVTSPVVKPGQRERKNVAILADY